MPLVRIDLVEGRDADEVQAITDVVHQALVDEYRINSRDRFQIVTEHPSRQIVADTVGLDLVRTRGIVMIHIFTLRGRATEEKTALYDRIHSELTKVGVASGDVVISYAETGPDDWSFGAGRAQYVTGELTPAVRT